MKSFWLVKENNIFEYVFEIFTRLNHSIKLNLHHSSLTMIVRESGSSLTFFLAEFYVFFFRELPNLKKQLYEEEKMENLVCSGPKLNKFFFNRSADLTHVLLELNNYDYPTALKTFTHSSFCNFVIHTTVPRCQIES